MILPAWIIRTVSGLVEGHMCEPELMDAAKLVGADLYVDALKHAELIECLRLNMINRKRYSANKLIRHHELDVSERTFLRLKYELIEDVARRMNLIS